MVTLDRFPAQRLVAEDVGLAGFALGVERIEFLLQTFFGGFTVVDGAVKLWRHLRNPKKSGPDHPRPVILRVTAVRLLYF
jgi:hypothetical protein